MSEPEHVFGGPWTKAKLEVLRKYLKAYRQIMKGQQFITAYIDAFAGSGSVDTEPGPRPSPQAALIAPQDPESGTSFDGSARVALKIQPPFERYIFIEQSRKRCEALEALRCEFKELADKIVIQCGEANAEVLRLCDKNWARRRAVLFLDPYGMQLEWATIEAVAKTKAIDMWLLFPLAMGPTRMITETGDMPIGWSERLDKFFGSAEWREVFYQRKTKPTLFGTETVTQRAVGEREIAAYVKGRLDKLFPGVSSSIGRLRNSRNSTLYLLFFAAANPNGAKTAIKIANDLLKGISDVD